MTDKVGSIVLLCGEGVHTKDSTLLFLFLEDAPSLIQQPFKTIFMNESMITNNNIHTDEMGSVSSPPIMALIFSMTKYRGPHHKEYLDLKKKNKTLR